MGSVFDLHIHSVFSGDSPVEPEEYIDYLVCLRRDFQIDGLVFCEHRRFVSEVDYRALSERYGLVVLAGVEAETRWGHLLIYCADYKWMSEMDFEQKFEAIELVKEVEIHNGVAIPAHPFRGMMGMGERVRELPYLYAIETINGANRAEENLYAVRLAEELRVGEVGGSDAHFLEELGCGLTGFEVEVRSMEDLVREVKGKRVKAIKGKARFSG